jgi:hypothetical protein
MYCYSNSALFYVCLGKQRLYNWHGHFKRPPAALQSVLADGQACRMLVYVSFCGITLTVCTTPEKPSRDTVAI